MHRSQYITYKIWIFHLKQQFFKIFVDIQLGWFTGRNWISEYILSSSHTLLNILVLKMGGGAMIGNWWGGCWWWPCLPHEYVSADESIPSPLASGCLSPIYALLLTIHSSALRRNFSSKKFLKIGSGISPKNLSKLGNQSLILLISSSADMSHSGIFLMPIHIYDKIQGSLVQIFHFLAHNYLVRNSLFFLFFY